MTTAFLALILISIYSVLNPFTIFRNTVESTENVNSFMLSYRTSHAPNDREINHLIGKLGTVTFWDYDGGGSISVMVKFDSSKPLKELQKQLNGTVSKA